MNGPQGLYTFRKARKPLQLIHVDIVVSALSYAFAGV